MGYTGAEAHVYADELGDTFSDDMVERMFERLDRPERCPHGWPVDPAFEQAENQELEPLAELDAGSRATIVRLAEHDGDLLHWFYDQGLVPGAEIEIEAAHPEAGQFTVRLDGGERAVSEKAAAGLFVRRGRRSRLFGTWAGVRPCHVRNDRRDVVRADERLDPPPCLVAIEGEQPGMPRVEESGATSSEQRPIAAEFQSDGRAHMPAPTGFIAMYETT
jgi:Fe2+ transport system protein FeoA